MRRARRTLLATLVLVIVVWYTIACLDFFAQRDELLANYREPESYAAVYGTEDVQVHSVSVQRVALNVLWPPAFRFTVAVDATVNGERVRKGGLSAEAGTLESRLHRGAYYRFEPVVLKPK